MAQPVTYRVVPPSQRGVPGTRLENAPAEHAEAVLAAYDVLQQLHDRGILEIVKGCLAAGDELLEAGVEAVNTPDAIRALRNLMFWRTILGRIEPEWFQGIFQAIPDGLAIATAQRDEPMTLWRILRRAVNRDSIRGLTAAVDFLESFGRHLNSLEHGVPARQPSLTERR